jgi:hypothetical protein
MHPLTERIIRDFYGDIITVRTHEFFMIGKIPVQFPNSLLPFRRLK